mgnify:CR=1 FL=1
MAYFAILRIKLQNTIGIFNDMKDLLDRFEVAYTSIFDEDPVEEETEKEETIATRVIKRCKKRYWNFINPKTFSSSCKQGFC